ncbi:kinase-like domain-containing protein [Podospora fimiseda]|uniref:Kinase-like domain-containing protein n=1 Tax=Podospora fimiseda TaxID=252190 RepID=A0AAN7BXS9_9PEZI|nr:kinase-like domain-containing protein [Podospora fimiseda]
MFRLAQFVKDHTTKRGSLGIVYYAGHCDQAESTNRPGFTEWRAKKNGGPTLDWYNVQPALYLAKGDIVLILDCCHAMNRTRQKIQGKMEILAACGFGAIVPGPGKHSFTSALMRQLRAHLRKDTVITIKWLSVHLWDEETRPDPTQSPAYFQLGDQPSIVLKRLTSPPTGFTNKRDLPSSFMLLKVSLADDPSGLQIATWLSSFRPKMVQKVDIEALILKARTLENIKDYSHIFPGSILGKLSQTAQAEILTSIRGLSRVMASTATLAKETVSEVVGPNVQQKAIKDIERKIYQVVDVVQSNILLDNAIQPGEATQDEVMIAIEAKSVLELRQQVLETLSLQEPTELSRVLIQFIPQPMPRDSRFRLGMMKVNPIILQSFPYIPQEGAISPSQPDPITLDRFRRMTSLLSHKEQTSKYVLRCLGYLKEPLAKQISLVFEVPGPPILPSQSLPPIPTTHTLHDLYQYAKHVPLGIRFEISHALTSAVQGLHRVGWVHRELQSRNVLFFDFSTTKSPMPYVFGFEYSRPHEAESELLADFSPWNNAYRHPQRWGKPGASFTKGHDVYSLGVILFEIAAWKSISKLSCTKSNASQRVDSDSVKKEILALMAGDRLAHSVGGQLIGVIERCLSFEEEAAKNEEGELEGYRRFRAEVVEPLRRLVDVGV